MRRNRRFLFNAAVIVFCLVVGITLLCRADTIIKGEKLAGYDADQHRLPENVIQADDEYYAILKSYTGEEQIELLMGSDPEKMKPFYQVDNEKSVWYMDANDGIVAWSEFDDSSHQVKTYEKDQGVKTIYSAKGDGFIPHNVYVGDGCVYYADVDYSKHRAGIVKYDTASEKTEYITDSEFDAKSTAPIQSFQVTGNVLVGAFCPEKEVMIRTLPINKSDKDSHSLKKSRNVKFAELEGYKVDYVYSTAYDEKDDVTIVYCASHDEEAGEKLDSIAYFAPDESEAYWLDDLDDNHYVYHDQLECKDGIAYYIDQANVSGEVADHYDLCGFNLYTDNPIEAVPNVYSVTARNSVIYSVWPEGDTDKAEIMRGTPKDEVTVYWAGKRINGLINSLLRGIADHLAG